MWRMVLVRLPCILGVLQNLRHEVLPSGMVDIIAVVTQGGTTEVQAAQHSDKRGC